MQQLTLPASHSGLLQGKSLRPALAPAHTPPAPRFQGQTGRQHYPPCGKKEGQSSAGFKAGSSSITYYFKDMVQQKKMDTGVNHQQKSRR